MLVKSAVLTIHPQDAQIIAYIRYLAPFTVSSLSSNRVDVHFGQVGAAIVFLVGCGVLKILIEPSKVILRATMKGG